MIKKSLLMMMAFALIATAAFAQRVGDTVQYAGSSYTVTAINGDDVTMRKVVAQGNGPVNWVAVGGGGSIAYSSDGTSWTAVPSANRGRTQHCQGRRLGQQQVHRRGR